MSRPFWASGVTTMKMMSSTSITSMRGVMLMSEVAPIAAGRVASWEWTADFFFRGWADIGYPCTLASAMRAISSTPASRQKSMTFMTSE